MSRKPSTWMTAATLIALCSCSSYPQVPLVFAQTQTVGITVSGSTTTQSGEFSLGYRDFDVAVIPLAVSQPGGNATGIHSKTDCKAIFGADGKPIMASDGTPQKMCDEEVYSVLGQFQVGTNSGTSATSITPQVTLGKFFATGSAARSLADGFKAKLGAADATIPSTNN